MDRQIVDVLEKRESSPHCEAISRRVDDESHLVPAQQPDEIRGLQQFLDDRRYVDRVALEIQSQTLHERDVHEIARGGGHCPGCNSEQYGSQCDELVTVEQH